MPCRANRSIGSPAGPQLQSYSVRLVMLAVAVAAAMVGLFTLAAGQVGRAQAAGSGPAPAANAALPAATWNLSDVTPPRPWFSDMTQRSLRLDAAGNPRVAYGTDHLYYTRYDGSQWQRQVVDPAQGVGAYASLALDAAGNPYIAYMASAAGGTTLDTLKYARWTGTIWNIQTVDAGLLAGSDTSLAIDGAGNAHISYCDLQSAGLHYAHWTGTAWNIQTLPATFCRFTSLALDSAGHPHISFTDNGLLRYAAWNGTTWSTETVEQGAAPVDMFPSLALDAQDRPHISYHDDIANLLKYAHWTGAAWDIQVVDSHDGWRTSIALDGLGRPRISYIQRPASPWQSNFVALASLTTSGWLTQTVDTTASEAGDFTSLALDSAGKPVTAYCNYDSSAYTCRELRVATRTSTGWSVAIADSASAPYIPEVSLALDKAGNAHLGYGVQTPGAPLVEARHAYQVGSAWQQELAGNGVPGNIVLDAGDGVHLAYADNRLYYASRGTGGAWTATMVDSLPQPYMSIGPISVVLDTAGNPHISYVAEWQVRYAYWTGTSWHVEPVDSGARPGSAPSLALDSAGRPHITYCGLEVDTCLTVEYAHWTGTEWVFQTVARGDAPSLALDSVGTPHIAYSALSGTLEYASLSAGGWLTETVGVKGQNPSLRLDPSNGPHLSFYDPGAGVKYAARPAISWAVETVDADPNRGRYNALALDSAGQPRIAYTDERQGNVRYAERSAAAPAAAPAAASPTAPGLAPVPVPTPPVRRAWSTQTVEQLDGYAPYNSLALDHQGRPRIVYEGLTYAEWDGTTWVKTGIGGSEAWYPSLAIDSQDNPHVTYLIFYLGSSRTDPGDLGYLKRIGGAWSGGTVSEYGLGWYPSLAFDGAGVPYTSFFYSYGCGPGYVGLDALGHGGEGEIESLGPACGIGDTSLAFDAAGQPHMAYYDEGRGRVRYAVWTGTAWNVQMVDAAVGHIEDPAAKIPPGLGHMRATLSLKLDAAGNPHLSYYDYTHAVLRYAHWDGANWLTETVDAAGKVGKYNSLALDSHGQPHIAYSEETHGDLRYARRAGASWLLETVDAAGWTGLHTSFALDSQDRPHISYYERVRGELRYATAPAAADLLERVCLPIIARH
jgi:hypothetical protein